MARTVDQIKDALLGLAPSWWTTEGLERLIIKALATSLQDVEAWWDTVWDNLFRETASGSWLDRRGAEIDVPRRPGEPDSVYRERLVRHFHRATVGHVLEELDRLCARGGRQRYIVEYDEPRWRPTGNQKDGFFTDDPQSLTLDVGDPLYLGKITVRLPPLLDLGVEALYTGYFDSDGSFTDVDAHTLDTPVDRQCEDVQRISSVVDINRPAATVTLVEFTGYPTTDEMLIPLFSQETGLL